MKKTIKITMEIDAEDIDIESTIKNAFKFNFKTRIIDIENVKQTRTTAQNSALHLWFGQLSQALNEKHIGVRMLLSEEIETEWTPKLVKEILWRKIQIHLFGKKSTRQLFKSKEIDVLFDTINKIVSERTNGEVDVPPFPSFENQSLDQLN